MNDCTQCDIKDGQIDTILEDIDKLKQELSEKDKRINELEGIIKDNADGIEMLDERQCEIFNEIV